jgi:hypothetical protein
VALQKILQKAPYAPAIDRYLTSPCAVITFKNMLLFLGRRESSKKAEVDPKSL